MEVPVTATFTLTPDQWHELRNRAGVYLMREGLGQELTLEQDVIVALCIAARDAEAERERVK